MANAKTQEAGARDVVERSRLGDQNAVAIIRDVAKNAAAGSPKAKTAYAYIEDYIKAHPAPSKFSAEDGQKLGVLKALDKNHPRVVVPVLMSLPESGNTDLINTASVMLAQTKPWNTNKVKAVAGCFDGENLEIFRFGFESGSNSKHLRQATAQMAPAQIGVLCCGHCVGMARKLQLARLPQVPVSILGDMIGWEMGC